MGPGVVNVVLAWIIVGPGVVTVGLVGVTVRLVGHREDCGDYCGAGSGHRGGACGCDCGASVW